MIKNQNSNPLSNILIIPNVISKKGLKKLKEHIQKSGVEDLSVFDPHKSNQTRESHWRVDKNIRDTQCVSMSGIENQLEQLFRETVKEIINPFYGIEVTSSELPQILSYSPGGHYKPHVDAEAVWKSPKGELLWKKSVDRDLSIIFYLNDDFEGGEFVFPELRVRVRPEPGMLVCFPSNHFYLHGVEPVTKGKRYSIVTWAKVRGYPSLSEINDKLSKQYGVPVS